jgi:hypothetical protein
MVEWRAEDCVFEPSSLVDPIGRLFHRDGRVFRAIRAPHGAFVRDLIARARANGWSQLGLVETWEADVSLPGYEAVVEHRRIPFMTLRGEWSAEGLRAAGRCILGLQAALLRQGLCLKDAHPWNVLFDGPRAHFVDWGSIRPAAELHWDFWYAKLRQFVIAPLYLFSRGRPRMARAMLREHGVGMGNEVLALPALRRTPRAAADIAAAARTGEIHAAVDQLSAYLAAITLPVVPGEWQRYPQPSFEGLDAPGLRAKDRIVLEALQRDAGSTVFDLGTNNGLHAEMAAALGKRVLACDIEESCLDQLYLRAASKGSDVLPLYYDFLWPIGDSGFMNSIPGSSQRLRCDTVLAMAVAHHLVLRREVSFEALARGLRALCNRRVVVEFIPHDDVHVATWAERFPAWYTLAEFTAAMRRHFSQVTMVPSEPAPRVVLVCDGALPL